ncbi:MAG: nuclear transport factor 2 family protein [Actinomycetota bacterium]
MQVYKPLFILPVLILSVFSASAQSSRTLDEAKAKRDLLALEQKWLQAENDPGVQEQILADDFVHALPSGFISKKDQVDYLRRTKQPANHLRKHFENLKVRIYGTAGVVNGIVVAVDKSGAPVRQTVFTDVFAYRHGRWQAVNSQENPYHPRGAQ